MKTRGTKNLTGTGNANDENQSPNGLVERSKKPQTRSVIKKKKELGAKKRVSTKMVEVPNMSDGNQEDGGAGLSVNQGHANAIGDERPPNESVNRRDISDENIKQLIEEIRLSREDVLVYAYTNSSRLDAVEEMVGKVIDVLDKAVDLVESLDNRMTNIEKVSQFGRKFKVTIGKKLN